MIITTTKGIGSHNIIIAENARGHVCAQIATLLRYVLPWESKSPGPL